MDYSYFIMGLSTSDSTRYFYNPDDPKPYDTTADGYRYAQYDYDFDDHPFELDMHWVGTMIGSDKTLSSPNFVQGDVNMTITKADRYDFKMEISIGSLINLSTGSLYHAIVWDDVGLNEGGGFFSSLQGGTGAGYTLYGDFTGPNAEEAVGNFNRDSLTGVFGAKLGSCSPPPC